MCVLSFGNETELAASLAMRNCELTQRTRVRVSSRPDRPRRAGGQCALIAAVLVLVDARITRILGIRSRGCDGCVLRRLLGISRHALQAKQEGSNWLSELCFGFS